MQYLQFLKSLKQQEISTTELVVIEYCIGILSIKLIGSIKISNKILSRERHGAIVFNEIFHLYIVLSTKENDMAAIILVTRESQFISPLPFDIYGKLCLALRWKFMLIGLM